MPILFLLGQMILSQATLIAPSAAVLGTTALVCDDKAQMEYDHAQQDL